MGKNTYLSEAERSRQEKAYAEMAWLNYFNYYLYTQGVISEREYKLMVDKIAQRCAKSSRRTSLR